MISQWDSKTKEREVKNMVKCELCLTKQATYEVDFLSKTKAMDGIFTCDDCTMRFKYGAQAVQPDAIVLEIELIPNATNNDFKRCYTCGDVLTNAYQAPDQEYYQCKEHSPLFADMKGK